MILQMQTQNLFDSVIHNTDYIILLIFGVLAFTTKSLNQIVNGKEKKKFGFFLGEFSYTIVAIIAGYSVCVIFKFESHITLLVSVVCGLLGSTAIRMLVTNEESIIRIAWRELYTKLKEKLKLGKSNDKPNMNNSDT